MIVLYNNNKTKIFFFKLLARNGRVSYLKFRIGLLAQVSNLYVFLYYSKTLMSPAHVYLMTLVSQTRIYFYTT